MATRHASSRLHTGHAKASDVPNSREPHRGHEPVWLTCIGIALMLALAFAAYVELP